MIYCFTLLVVTRPLTSRELLLTAIRNNEFQLRPVPPKSLQTSSNSTGTTNQGSTGKHSGQRRRKVIRIDRSRLSADSDPEDECSTSSSTPTVPPEENGFEENEEYKPVRLNPQIRKLRTVAMTRSRSLSPPPEVGSRLGQLSKQHTVYETVTPDEELSTAVPYHLEMENPLSDEVETQTTTLTFQELSRIRSVLTAAELEQLAVCPNVQSDVAQGRVCFTCRKVKFNLIHWPIRCRLCSWNVCQKCILPAVQLPGSDRDVPVCCDCNELLDMINQHPRSPSSSLSPSESSHANNTSNTLTTTTTTTTTATPTSTSNLTAKSTNVVANGIRDTPA